MIGPIPKDILNLLNYTALFIFQIIGIVGLYLPNSILFGSLILFISLTAFLFYILSHIYLFMKNETQEDSYNFPVPGFLLSIILLLLSGGTTILIISLFYIFLTLTSIQIKYHEKYGKKYEISNYLEALLKDYSDTYIGCFILLLFSFLFIFVFPQSANVNIIELLNRKQFSNILFPMLLVSMSSIYFYLTYKQYKRADKIQKHRRRIIT